MFVCFFVLCFVCLSPGIFLNGSELPAVQKGMSWVASVLRSSLLIGQGLVQPARTFRVGLKCFPVVIAVVVVVVAFAVGVGVGAGVAAVGVV